MLQYTSFDTYRVRKTFDHLDHYKRVAQTDVVFMDSARRSILLTTPRCCKNCGNMVSPVLFSSDLKITYVDACSG